MRDEFTSVLVEPPRKEIKLEMQRDLGRLVEEAAPACPTSHHPFSSSSPMPYSAAAAADGPADHEAFSSKSGTAGTTREAAAEAAFQQQPSTTKGRPGSGKGAAPSAPAQQSSADAGADYDLCDPAIAASELQQQDSRTSVLHTHINKEAMAASVPSIPDCGACSTASSTQGDSDHDPHASLRDTEGASSKQHQHPSDLPLGQQGSSNGRRSPAASQWHADVRLDVHEISFLCHRLIESTLRRFPHLLIPLCHFQQMYASWQGSASEHCGSATI